jgi:hypothetical protein
MHFCALRWPSWLGRQTHRVFEQIHWRRHLRHLEVAGSDPVRSIRILGTMLFSSTLLFFNSISRTLYYGFPTYHRGTFGKYHSTV